MVGKLALAEHKLIRQIFVSPSGKFVFLLSDGCLTIIYNHPPKYKLKLLGIIQLEQGRGDMFIQIFKYEKGSIKFFQMNGRTYLAINQVTRFLFVKVPDEGDVEGLLE